MTLGVVSALAKGMAKADRLCLSTRLGIGKVAGNPGVPDTSLGSAPHCAVRKFQ
jgi:hypothetical protein